MSLQELDREVQKMTTDNDASTTILPAGIQERRKPGRIRLSPEQRKALDFLGCRNATLAKVLVGGESTGKTTLLNKFCAELNDCTVLRIQGGKESDGGIFTLLLRAAGLNPASLSRDETGSLFTVFLRQEKNQGRSVLIAVDGAEKLGSEAWSDLEDLHALQLEKQIALELIIVGQPDIYRAIRSPVDGWRCANTSFHTLEPGVPPAVAPSLPQEEPRELIVSENGDVVGRITLQPRFLIGRNLHNDLCLTHPSLSRHHAVVVSTPDGYYVVDLNSKNGLTVNGESVTSAVLRDGDVMSLGPYRIKLSACGYKPLADPRPAYPSLSGTATMQVEPRKGLRSIS